MQNLSNLFSSYQNLIESFFMAFRHQIGIKHCMTSHDNAAKDSKRMQNNMPKQLLRAFRLSWIQPIYRLAIDWPMTGHDWPCQIWSNYDPNLNQIWSKYVQTDIKLTIKWLGTKMVHKMSMDWPESGRTRGRLTHDWPDTDWPGSWTTGIHKLSMVPMRCIAEEAYPSVHHYHLWHVPQLGTGQAEFGVALHPWFTTCLQHECNVMQHDYIMIITIL